MGPRTSPTATRAGTLMYRGAIAETSSTNAQAGGYLHRHPFPTAAARPGYNSMQLVEVHLGNQWVQGRIEQARDGSNYQVSYAGPNGPAQAVFHTQHIRSL